MPHGVNSILNVSWKINFKCAAPQYNNPPSLPPFFCPIYLTSSKLPSATIRSRQTRYVLTYPFFFLFLQYQMVAMMTRMRSKAAATHPPMMACILDLSFSVGIAVVTGVVTVVVSAKRICTLDILAFMELESSTSDP